MKNILFVCAGNTCRSPMAEYVMKMLYRQQGRSGEIASRGISVDSEFTLDEKRRLYVSPHALVAIKEIDPATDISRHIPRPLTYDDVQHADLILTMEQKHRDNIIDHMQHCYRQRVDGNVFTLKECAGKRKNDYDLADPMGRMYNYLPVTGPVDDEEDIIKIKGKNYLVKRKSEQEILRIYRNCRDEIRQCLETILAQGRN